MLEGARIGIWGLGRETMAFLRALEAVAPGAELTAVASDSIPDEYPELGLDVPVVNSAEALEVLGGVDVVVRSPGVSIYSEPAKAIQESGARLTTSTALWLSEASTVATIGVTGTKGKSTTASLIAHLLAGEGKRVELVGNIGRPAMELADLNGIDVVVLELSSFQIADLADGVDIAVFTNLFPEHADWHGSYEIYIRDKLRLAELDSSTSKLVVNADSEELRRRTEAWGPIRVGADRDPLRRLGVSEADFSGPDASALLRGTHNFENFRLAVAAAEAFGLHLSAESVCRAISSFRPLPHRLQPLSSPEGEQWFDDSISTTPESTLAAMAAFPGEDLVLILGGFDRGQDYSELLGEVEARDATIICIPDNGDRIVEEAKRLGLKAERVVNALSLEAAVENARPAARAGSTILLSPAAPSFGVFRSFEDRGRAFARAVTRDAG